jgi:pimeloyl-ACP methyl ester carboxylesterase
MTRRLFLLPGLGADERLFAGIESLCLSVITPRLPVPQPNESMSSYSLRVAATLDLRPEDWIGGCSFGSIVAADIARRRQVKGLVLIGGALTPDTLVSAWQWLALLRPLLPVRGLRPLLSNHTVLSFGFGAVPEDVLKRLLEMFRDTPDAMLTEGARMLGDYRPAIPPLCPVHAIHGALDRIMRPPPVPDCHVLHDAGHALALTHPHEVSTFLRSVIC